MGPIMSDLLFISHASADAEAVEHIVAYLEANNVRCWIAGRDIPPRSIYAEAITQGVKDSTACAVIVSQAANESDAIKRELELASHYRKPFIPIRIDGAEPGPGLDYYLRNTQWIDYRRDGERALDRIFGRVPKPISPAPLSAPARGDVTPMDEPHNDPPATKWPAIAVIAAILVLGGAMLLWPRENAVLASSVTTESAPLPANDVPAEAEATTASNSVNAPAAANSLAALRAIASITDREWATENVRADLAPRVFRRTPASSLIAAASEGNVRAQIILSVAYETGQGGFAGNQGESLAWARRAADSGNPEGLYHLGETLRSRTYSEQGIDLIERAANAGLVNAQYSMVSHYSTGPHRNDGETVRYYRMCAAQAFAPCQESLGNLYMRGERGLPVDTEQGARLKCAAVRSGYELAIINPPPGGCDRFP